MLRQLWAIFIDTLREASSRWVFVGTALSGTVSAVMLLWFVQTVTIRLPHSALTVLSQSDPRFLDNAFLARDVLASTASIALWTQVAFAIALLTGLIAPLMSAERNALVLATPVPRMLLLTGRYLGLAAIGLYGITITFCEVWFAASWKFGVWHWPFLAGIGTAMLVVSAILAMLMLLQTAIDSPAVSIVAITALCLLSAGAQHPDKVRDMTGSPLIADIAVHLGHVLPRSSEIAQWTAIYINSGTLANPAPLFYTALGSVVFVTSAGLLFTRKEL